MKSPVRVLQLVTSMDRGGIETMLMNYYREVDRSKIQFDFLVHRSTPADFDQEIRDLGGRIFTAPAFTARNTISYQKRLSTLIRSYPEYQIFHSHLNSLSGIPLYTARKHGVPVRIAHSHTAGYTEGNSAPLRRLLKNDLLKKLIPHSANYLAACSSAAGDFMFGPRNPYILLRNAIDPESFLFDDEIRKSIRTELGIHPHDFVIGNVANLSRQKNHIFLLKIFKEILVEHPNSKLVLVGRPSTEAVTLNQYIEANNLQENVILTGPRSDVNELLQAMDIFIMPSLNEGLGLAAIEAQAAGLPCVFSDAVPTEVAITNSCQFISLDESPKYWSNEILKTFTQSLNKRRGNDVLRQIKDSGYDVSTEAIKLTEIYLSSLQLSNQII